MIAQSSGKSRVQSPVVVYSVLFFILVLFTTTVVVVVTFETLLNEVHGEGSAPEITAPTGEDATREPTTYILFVSG